MRLKHTARAALLFLFISGCSAAPAIAKDKEFAPIADQLKTQYRARRQKIPFLGLANLAVKIVRPAGVKGFKLAIFEDLQFDPEQRDFDLSAFVRNTLGREWRPLVRVFSRANREQTHIYVKGEGGKKDLKLMIVTVDGSEAVLLRVKLNPHTLVKWMHDPKIMGISLAGKSAPKQSPPAPEISHQPDGN